LDHLAIPVSDQKRSRRFYETYFGFGARPARRYDDGVLMPYDAKGFALAVGLAEEDRPTHLDALRRRDARSRGRPRAARPPRRGRVELVEEWDEPDYASVKCGDPDGYIVEAAWEPER
jgi:catechol 2,3-dioxygenase-like lactoylglutathione lyase family enzyme